MLTWCHPTKRTFAACLFALMTGAGVSHAADTRPTPDLDAPTLTASADATTAFDWIRSANDNRGLPYAVVDKKGGAIWVFDADGQLRGNSAALLGLTPGDGATPGMAQRKVSSLRRDERTTPAGRFVTEPGHNLQGEPIVWLDYDAKLAIHRLRPALAAERRAERIASPTADDKRISFGCVVVPVAFYEDVIAPVLGKGYGVVYVLPETRPLATVLGVTPPLQVTQR